MFESTLGIALRSLLGGVLAALLMAFFRVRHPVFRKITWAVVIAASFCMFLLHNGPHLAIPHISEPSLFGSALDAVRTTVPNIPQFAARHQSGSRVEIHLGGAVAFSWSEVAAIADWAIVALLLVRIAGGLFTAASLWSRATSEFRFRNTRLRFSSEIETPCTFGLHVLLPAALLNWNADELAPVLAHEVSHVRQFDFFLQLGARIYTAVFWFSPFGWWLQTECARLGEETSDYAAIQVSPSAMDYASLLLKVSANHELASLVYMARPSSLRVRIDQILTPGRLKTLFLHPLRSAVINSMILLVAVMCANLSVAARVSAMDIGGVSGTPDQVFRGFDIISVKPHRSGGDETSMNTDDMHFHATNVPLKLLLTNAYGIRAGLISGLPAWAEKTNWDVEAKMLTPGPATKGEVSDHAREKAEYETRLQSILVERFHLKVHEAVKTLPVYDLVVTNGGVRFKETQAPVGKRGMMLMNDGSLSATGSTMSALAESLSEEVERTVLDKTGLEREYDLDLHWTPEDRAVTASEAGVTDAPPPIFTALQEQLGLKLVAGRGPVKVLIVDEVLMPKAN